MLGINQDDLETNLRRVGDSAAIGGITGGVMGGATTAASQPYNTQFAENQNTTNPIEAVKNVSAKIADSGKVLYDSTTQQLNNIAAVPNKLDSTTAAQTYATKEAAALDFNGSGNTALVIASGVAGGAFTNAVSAVFANGASGYLPSGGEIIESFNNQANKRTPLGRPALKLIYLSAV